MVLHCSPEPPCLNLPSIWLQWQPEFWLVPFHLTNLTEDHPRIISAKFQQKWPSSFRVDVIWIVFLRLPWRPAFWLMPSYLKNLWWGPSKDHTDKILSELAKMLSEVFSHGNQRSDWSHFIWKLLLEDHPRIILVKIGQALSEKKMLSVLFPLIAMATRVMLGVISLNTSGYHPRIIDVIFLSKLSNRFQKRYHLSFPKYAYKENQPRTLAAMLCDESLQIEQSW